MKKILWILLLIFSISLIFTACGDDENESSVQYTISWFDENGNSLAQNNVNEGTAPSYTYTVTDTAEWDYTFMGWSESKNGEVLSSIPNASKNVSYYAIVKAEKQKYTVTFNTLGGSEVAPQTVEYGSKATAPDAPVYEGHKFMGWSTSASEAIAVDFSKAITGNVEYFAVWNELVDIKGLLSALLKGYDLNPYLYIPESMLSNYSENLVDAGDISNDYSSFVNVSNISYGHGEQWHMVLDNLAQTSVFFNVLSVVEAISATSVSAFNNYFDSNPSDTARYNFESGIYNVTIDFDGEIMYYVLDYTADVPLLGNQTIQIALAMNAESGEKNVRIQIGDANALAYKVLNNSYEFAIKYLGIRTAMFSITRDEEGNVDGKIYEYLTVSSAEIASCAEFYITEDYVSVVGNKADSMIGFTGYITELYSADDGKLIGYEVQETLSSVVYNTLWFTLDGVSGINTIKYTEGSGSEAGKFFVNGSNRKWESKRVGEIGSKILSRRFDIEFKTQYVYSYDTATEKYTEHKIDVPMIFVQEEYYDTFVADVNSTNNINLTVLIANADLEKLLADYDTLIPDFIENKDSVSSENIIAHIKDTIIFT